MQQGMPDQQRAAILESRAEVHALLGESCHIVEKHMRMSSMQR